MGTRFKFYNILSYWYFLYFLLFQLKIVKYSPYLFFLIVLLSDIFNVIMMKDKKKLSNHFYYFRLLIIFIIHIIPILFLKIDLSINSLIFNLIVCVIYIMYITIIKKENLIDFYSNLLDCNKEIKKEDDMKTTIRKWINCRF